ncbi:MAG: hypothetical protein ACXWXO_12460 [Nocardioides sp.]
MTGSSARPLLSLGRVQRLRVQVGYRARPDGPAYEQFLLDLPVGESALDEARVLAALEPVLYVGSAASRHYSLHQHRWHTSWGLSPGVLELGLLVTTGTRTTAASDAALDGVTRAFRELIELAGRPEATTTSRDAAVQSARSAAATAYGLDPETLSLSAEQHHAAANSWTVGLRSSEGDEYDVQVGVVDGYAGSVRVRHDVRTEVSDSVGSE